MPPGRARPSVPRHLVPATQETLTIRPEHDTIVTALQNLNVQDSTSYVPSTPPPYKHDPTFLGLPRELRNQIYGHLLIVDKSPEYTPNPHRWEREFGNIRLLCVNRQVRAEAWEILRTTNIFINVTVATKLNTPNNIGFFRRVPDRHLVQPYIDLGLFGPAEADELRRGSALHIWLGENCGKDNIGKTVPQFQAHNMVLAYSMRTYGSFCNELAAKVRQFRSISIDVNPRPTAPFSFILQEVILPLRIIRGVERACFRGIMKIKLFANIAKGMVKSLQSQDNLIKTLLSFKDKGNEVYKKSCSLPLLAWQRSNGTPA